VKVAPFTRRPLLGQWKIAPRDFSLTRVAPFTRRIDGLDPVKKTASAFFTE
jgi:hypothetical protein